MKPFPSILHLYVSPGGHFMQTSLFSIEPPRPMYLKNICVGIIISAAPTLVTLFLQYPVTLGILEGDGIHFPRLRDLSIPHASRPSCGPALQTYICPAVERLHVTQCFPRGINLWEEIDVCIGSFLKALLNISSSESSVATHANPTQAQGAVHIANVAAHLPDTRAVIVQPFKYVNSGWCGTGSIMNG
ncbi:hypothetical protein PHLGIDRAFT_336795 [Phlebiopsis gigantea 11061_1 CR5-6]|uniref:Uncharacterized protein n=1 Tax=Phlebiopsis gigantea (strain 11061_1 CR5-6) TaxID=745531 RepID=A0A0C3NB49_PHLG1|nr:hypothetical protein PHLGIDRAFT_336795 [Phlebiopsis gigantea 11061_1 CR5-6]